MKPVYIVNGFLDSGKTEFITYTMSQPYFQVKGTTLLLLCEEGEQEYPEELLRAGKTVVEQINGEEDFTPALLLEFEKKYKPERIVIEYNGMWNFKNMKLPWHWSVEQQITVIDASTFKMYYTNMKSLLAEMLRKSELVIFNRCDGIEELASFKRNVKAINQKADIVFEDENGEVNETLEEELPYSLQDQVIALDHKTYGIWYLDSLDHLERYVGKVVEFTALVLKPEQFPKDYFVPGRMAMTCCADDMAFLGFVCEYDGAEALEDRTWVTVRASIAKEYFADYNGEGPVLKAISVAKSKAPKEEIISFL